jgi:LysR family transcriptional regulator, glycine cleavage system transcriptional activator
MRRRILPLQAVRAFEAAGRLGRMTAAAEELSVTHGAISRQIQLLEDVLGVALFAGSRAKPELTDAGRMLVPALTSAFDQIEAAVQTVTTTEESILDVSCLSTFLIRWLIPRLHRFRDLNPRIDPRLQSTDQPADPQRTRFDVVITIEDVAAAATFGQHKVTMLFRERLGVVATPALIEKTKFAAPGDLPADRLLQTKTRVDAWSMWCAAMKIAPTAPAGAVFEHYYYTLEAACTGLGFCVAPWHLVANDVASGRLVAPFGFVESQYCYVAKPRLPSGVKADQFCQWLADEAAAMPMPAAA